MLEKYPIFAVIRTLLDKPKTYSVRELARTAKLSPSATKYDLDFLFASGILKRDIIGKTYQYTLNSDHFLTKQIRRLNSLFEISKSGMVTELTSKYQILSVCLYGSVARGEDDPESDIDFLIIARKDIKIGRLKSESALVREATFLVYTPAEWKVKARKDKVFYDRLILDAIPLYGEVPVV